MTTMLEDSQALRARIREEVPAGDVLDQALAALDQVDAVARLVAIDDEKAVIQALAKKDPDAMRLVEKQAWLQLAKAQAVASAEEQAEAEKAAAEKAAAVAAEAAVIAEPIKK